jgi:hypothetical protein
MQWDYLLEEFSLTDPVTTPDALLGRGAEGWEAVSTQVLRYMDAGTILIVLFKRPKRTPPRAGGTVAKTAGW